ALDAKIAPPLGSDAKCTRIGAGFGGIGSAVGIWIGFGSGACTTCAEGSRCSPRPAYQIAAPTPSATASAPPTNHTHHGVCARGGGGGSMIWLYGVYCASGICCIGSWLMNGCCCGPDPYGICECICECMPDIGVGCCMIG